MRITRELLLTHAHENAERLAARDRGIMCIYVTGSLLNEDPFLGGVTDIDLICVHSRPVDKRREVIRLSPDVSLDLAHYEQEAFEPARKLRTSAWLGAWLENVPLVLYDPLRWYDFTRASATAQIWRPENVAARARNFLVPARKAWADLQDGAVPAGRRSVLAYLTALRDTANGIATLTGAPLTTRRLMVDLPARANAAEMPGFYPDIIELFTTDEVNDTNFEAWSAAYPGIFAPVMANDENQVCFQPFRRSYYEKAIQALFPLHPAAAVWLQIYTWTKAAAAFKKDEQPYKHWLSLCNQLGLDKGPLSTRLDPLDHLLDTAEEAVDRLTG